MFVWHHESDRQSYKDESGVRRLTPLQPAEWEIPLIPGMEGWRFHGGVSHEIACALQEIPENGADVAHLDYVHGDFLLSWLTPLKHTWSANWDPQSEPEGHIAKLKLTQQVSLFGFKLPLTALDSHINQVGPALVHLIFPTPFGKVCVIETVTPVIHTLQRAQNVVWAEPTVPRFFAKVFLMGLVVQFERDMPIWNYKVSEQGRSSSRTLHCTAAAC